MSDRGVVFYFQVLWKRLWLLILVTLLGAGASAYVSYFYIVPEYETFTTILVGRPNNNNEKLEYSEVLLNQQLISTYREIAQSRTLSTKIIEELNLKCDYNDLRKKVDVTLINDTEIIKIRVRYDNPVLAAKIANETAAIFKEDVKALMRIDNIQIIDDAEIPARPVSPKPIQNIVIGSSGALMLILFIIVLHAFMNNKIINQEDIINYIGTPVIGVIPREPKSKNRKAGRKPGLHINEEEKSQYMEAYRVLRTNIQFISMSNARKIFVITSSNSSEGKSTVVSNLGYVLAQANKSVLLIDGDLRKPMLAETFSIPGDVGLTNVLAEGIELESAIQQIHGCRLYVMPSGPIPPNPSELLLCEKMKAILQELRSRFDIILIDTPPLGLVTDSADLAVIADGTIIVCSSGETDINSCKRIKLTLNNLNINILGAVLNKMKTKKSGYYRSKY